jgi:hypothetical protein
MDPRTAGGPGPLPPPGAGPRRRSTREEVLARLHRWKRGAAIAAVVGFGALIGLVGAVGARDETTAPTTPAAGDRSGGGGPRQAPGQRPDDGFFGRGDDDGGYGFGGGSQAAPLGRSGAS